MKEKEKGRRGKGKKGGGRQQLPFQKRDREREHRPEEAGDHQMCKHMSL